MKKDSKKEILEAVFKGSKNIYEIHKYIKEKFPDATYPPVLRMVKKLEDKKLIEEIKDIPRDNDRKAKFYEITTKGLSQLYILRRGNRDDLGYHRSNESMEIIRNIIENTVRNMNFTSEEKENFSKWLYASPSMVTFFTEFQEDGYHTLEIEDVASYQKFRRKIFDSMPSEKTLCTPIITGHFAFLKTFLLKILPLIYLSKDTEKYDDDEITTLLFEILKNENAKIGDAVKEREELTVKKVLTAIRKGIINPDLSTEKQYSKYSQYIKGKGEERNCPKYWVLYIPQIGNPFLACKGCPEQLKKIFEKNSVK